MTSIEVFRGASTYKRAQPMSEHERVEYHKQSAIDDGIGAKHEKATDKGSSLIIKNPVTGESQSFEKYMIYVSSTWGI